MALDDELATESTFLKRDRTDEWVTDWRETLSQGDRETWDAWLVSSDKQVSAMHRVLARKGFPYTLSTFRRWVWDQDRSK